MYVCSCHGIDEDEVRVAIGGGACSVEDVMTACSAGGDCGSCHPSIEDLLVDGSVTAATAA